MKKYASKERRDMHAEITKKMISELEQGTIPWLKPWKCNTSTGFYAMPRNAISKRRYSGVNVIILWIEAEIRGFVSNEWLTYKQAQERGGHVKKGEHGTQIVFLSRIKKETKNDAGEVEDSSYSLLKTYTVFNVEQCEELKLPQSRKVEKFEPTATEDGLDSTFMEAVKATKIDVRHGGDRAYYSVLTDHVQMPNVTQFKDAASYQATLAHELVHASGSSKRLNREGIITLKDKSKAVYAFEELVAEIGAAFTCAEFGIVGDLRHAGYVADYISLLKADKKAMMRAASRASRAVAYLFPETAEEYDNEEAPVIREAMAALPFPLGNQLVEAA